jgi:hypothetical protein
LHQQRPKLALLGLIIGRIKCCRLLTAPLLLLLLQMQMHADGSVARQRRKSESVRRTQLKAAGWRVVTWCLTGLERYADAFDLIPGKRFS